MTDETAQQKIERLEAEVRNLRLGMVRYSTEAAAAERDELVEASTP